MKIAVIKTGGKQYLVKAKDKIRVEKLNSPVGQKVNFDTLLVADGEEVQIGAPILSEKVEGTVLSWGRADKVRGVKYKPKTRQAKKFGHRQEFNQIEITKI